MIGFKWLSTVRLELGLTVTENLQTGFHLITKRKWKKSFHQSRKISLNFYWLRNEGRLFQSKQYSATSMTICHARQYFIPLIRFFLDFLSLFPVAGFLFPWFLTKISIFLAEKWELAEEVCGFGRTIKYGPNFE